MPLSIIILNDTAHVDGGAARVALASAAGLAGHGHRVTLFSAVPAGTLPMRAVGTLEVVSTGQQDILSEPNRLAAGLRGIWNRTAARRLREILAVAPAGQTVVHIHSWSKALSPSVLRVIATAGHPAVCTLHDYFLACPNGGLFNFRRQAHCDLTPLSPRCLVENCDCRCYQHKLWRAARLWVQRHIAGFPEAVGNFIAVSGYSRQLLEPYLPSAACVSIVSNPVDVPQQPPASAGADAPFVLVGRLSPEKGAELFARATAQAGVKGLVIGDGPLRRRLQIEWPHLEFTGWLEPQELWRRLRQARALVFPSLCHETQGLVVLEAAANGVPSVVADRCAARELIIDGVSGMWFNHGGVEDLALKMRDLDDSPTRATAMGHAAYRLYWDNPSTLERHLDQLEAVYIDMLGTA